MEPAQLEKVAVAVHGAELPVALCSSVVHDLDRNCSAVSPVYVCSLRRSPPPPLLCISFCEGSGVQP